MNQRRLATALSVIMSILLIPFFATVTSHLPLTAGRNGAVIVPTPGWDVVLQDGTPGNFRKGVNAEAGKVTPLLFEARGMPTSAETVKFTGDVGAEAMARFWFTAYDVGAPRIRFTWTPVPSAAAYVLEYSGPNRTFTDPNAAWPVRLPSSTTLYADGFIRLNPVIGTVTTVSSGGFFSAPSDLAFGASANSFIADTSNQRIRKVAAGTGIITTLAGARMGRFSGDGARATNAQLNFPSGVALDGSGNLLIAGVLNHQVRRVAPIRPDHGTAVVQATGAPGVAFSFLPIGIIAGGDLTRQQVAPGLIIGGESGTGTLIASFTTPGSSLSLDGTATVTYGTGQGQTAIPVFVDIPPIPSDGDAVDRDVITLPATVSFAAGPGWYEVSTPSLPAPGDTVTIMWRPGSTSDSTLPHTWTLRARDGASASVAWVYLDGSGTLAITAGGSTATPSPRSATDRPPALVRAVSSGEFWHRLKDIGFVGVLVSMYLLRWTALSCLWVLSVVALRWLAYSALHRLPPRQRKDAEEEITALLRLAKWGGVSSYAIWTIKDLVQLALSH
jgi:hypothetical protein